jgi:folate-binding protein YgfZ
MDMTAKIAHLPSRTVLALEGPDRFAFLQGLTSNDMKLAENGQPVFTCLLTPQGKYLFDFIVKPEGDHLLLDCEAERAEELLKRLTQFRLRANISLSRHEASVYAAWDDSEALPDAFVDPRLPQLGQRIITKINAKTSASADEYLNHRYAWGVAEGAHEIILNNATLLELNFDLLNGVSFTKGCYMGQELTARTHYRGLIKKRYFPFSFEGQMPVRGHRILSQEFEVGEVMAITETCGLGLFNLERVKPFIKEERPIVFEGASYTVTVPDYLKPVIS